MINKTDKMKRQTLTCLSLCSIYCTNACKLWTVFLFSSRLFRASPILLSKGCSFS